MKFSLMIFEKILNVKFIIVLITFLNVSCSKDIITNNSYIKSNYTSYFVNSTIKTLNNKNFDVVINSNESNNYLILFTFRRCKSCNKIIRITENVEKNYKSTNLKFAKVDCYSSGWTAMRFDIFKIPQYIYISHGYYSSFIPNNITEEDLINYIESDDKEYKEYPLKIGYFGIFMKIFHLITKNVQKKLPFWNELCSWLVLLILFGCFIFFEYSICQACINSNNTNIIDGKKDNNNKEIKKNKIKAD